MVYIPVLKGHKNERSNVGKTGIRCILQGKFAVSAPLGPEKGKSRIIMLAKLNFGKVYVRLLVLNFKAEQ